jgi:hypothetical protein
MSLIDSGIEAGATPFIHSRRQKTKGFFVDPVGEHHGFHREQ